jgi:hypothetical protein
VREIAFTPHAELMLCERVIEREWVLETVRIPERTEVDPSKLGRARAFRRVPENGNRWLRVVYEETAERTLVVTAFFDRGAGRWP